MKKGLLLLLLFIAGCADSQKTQDPVDPPIPTPGPGIISPNLVGTYLMPEQLVASFSNDRYISLRFEGREVRQYGKKEERKEHEALSIRFRDFSFNRASPSIPTYALGEVLTEIDAVCDRPIDGQHPAGSSLKDLIMICAMTHYDFIASNYDPAFQRPALPDEFRWLSFMGEYYESSPVFKLLKDLDETDLQLLCPELYLYFPEQFPAGRYTFTVKVTAENDVLTQTVTGDIK